MHPDVLRAELETAAALARNVRRQSDTITEVKFYEVSLPSVTQQFMSDIATLAAVLERVSRAAIEEDVA